MVRIKYFSLLRESLNKEEEEIEFEGSVKELIDMLCARYKEKEDLIRGSKVAINESYAEKDSYIKDGDRIALLPPLGGG